MNIRLPAWIPKPTIHQVVGLSLTNREVLWGGAAGGGKSYWLLMCASQYAESRDSHSLILRRTYPELEGTLIPDSKQMFQGHASYNEVKKKWTFPSGSTISFGHIQNDDDKHKYQSASFQTICFDEASSFTKDQYLYMMSRLRRNKYNNVPVRIRCASNPGGIGHEWLKERFVDTSNEIADWKSKIFIPARLEDNPHIDQVTYRENLMELDHVTRAQLLHGDWEIMPSGGLFHRKWFTPTQKPFGKLAAKVRYWDLAATAHKTEGGKVTRKGDYTVGIKMSRYSTDDGDKYFIEDMVRGKWSAGELDNIISNTAKLDGFPPYIEQEPAASGKIAMKHFEDLCNARGSRITGSKIDRANPLSAQFEHGNIFLLEDSERKPWNYDFVNEFVAFPDGSHDDIVDATSGAYTKCENNKLMMICA